MLSSPKWTAYDLCAFVVLVSLFVRVFGENTTPEQIARQPAMMNILSMPLPDARTSRGLDYRVRLDAVLRCAGLRSVLGGGDDQDLTPIAAMQGRFRVRNPDGAEAHSLRKRIRNYARAYRELARDRQERSQLILRRDSAMCIRYPEFREAGLHDRQDRQTCLGTQKSGASGVRSGRVGAGCLDHPA